MYPSLFLKGLALGLSIAAPVGPIALLCIRRTLTSGRAFGWATGLGAATADALYGSLAAFGLTVVSGALVQQSAWLRLTGGAFLCILGLGTFFSSPPGQSTAQASGSLWRAYLTGLGLTLTNPMTILSFAAVFAGVGVGFTGAGRAASACIVLGTFSGSTLWWLVLAAATERLRDRLNQRLLHWLNRCSGLALLAFGLSALLRAP